VFYPPHHQVHFDPQFIDDDVLTHYIAQKKNISLASSKYFTEKYINNLIQEALIKEVALADMGWLYFDQRICFKPVEAITNDPAFYGYPEIAISKLSSTSIYDQLGAIEARPPAYKPLFQPEQLPDPEPEPVVPAAPILKDEPVARPEVFTPQPEVYKPQPVTYTPPPEVFSPQPEEEQEEFIFRGKTYSGRDESNGRPIIRIIIIAVVALLLLAILGLAALYKFKPAAFRKLIGKKPAPVVLTMPLKRDTTKTIIIAKPDTAKKPVAPIVDTTVLATSTAPIDTFAHIRYEISGGAYKTLKAANTAIKNYQKLGLQARILKNVPGQYYHLTLGTYFTEKQAIHVEDSMLNTGKVTTNTIGLQPYYPKTNQ